MNNPPAFPNVSIRTKEGIEVYGESGMTLRDYFAAKAMQGMFASDTKDWNSQNEWQTRAEVAYEMADEMLKAREKC